jgi:hypothetical protein
MADDPSSETTPSGEHSPLDDLEDDPMAGSEAPSEGEGNPLAGEDPFAGDAPLASGAFGDEPPAVTMAKLWIRQNALLAVGGAFVAGTLIGALKK